MAKLDLSDPALKEALSEIKNEKSETRWVLFGFDKGSAKIKVSEKGKGGLEELMEELSSGQVQFGFMRYNINNLCKFVFISWCGDGVQGQAKGFYNNHSKDMEFFLKGSFHLQINARNESDLNEADITKKLLIAKGANFDAGKKVQGAQAEFITSVKEGQRAVTQAPSKEVKRTDPGIVDKDASTRYWEEQRKKEAEEASKRQAASSKPATVVDKEASTKYWEEQRKKEAEEASKRQAAGSKPSTVVDKEASAKFWQEQQAQQQQAAQQKPAPQARPTPSSGGSRSIAQKFEQQQREAAAQPPPPRSTKPAAKPAPAPAPAPVQPEPEPVPEQQPEPVPEPAPVYEPEQPVYQEEPEVEQPPVYEPEPVPEPVYEPEPQYEPEHVYEPEPQYEPEPVYEPEPELAPEPQYEPPQEEYPSEEPVQTEENEPSDYSASYMSRPPPPPSTAKPGQGKVRVRALYDFESGDANDLTFREGEIVTVTDQSGEDGWWQGEIEDRVGLFPSNYVEPLD